MQDMARSYDNRRIRRAIETEHVTGQITPKATWLVAQRSERWLRRWEAMADEQAQRIEALLREMRVEE